MFRHIGRCVSLIYVLLHSGRSKTAASSLPAPEYSRSPSDRFRSRTKTDELSFRQFRPNSRVRRCQTPAGFRPSSPSPGHARTQFNSRSAYVHQRRRPGRTLFTTTTERVNKPRIRRSVNVRKRFRARGLRAFVRNDFSAGNQYGPNGYYIRPCNAIYIYIYTTARVNELQY